MEKRILSVNTLKEILKKLDAEVREHELGTPFFGHNQYIPHPLNGKNFKPVQRIESKRRLAFIDGGNQEIIGAPNFSIQINRIFFCVFDSDRRVIPDYIPDRIEFFSATYAVFRKGQVHYDTIIQPIRNSDTSYIPKEADLSFSSVDRSVMQGNMRAEIGRVASLSRRFGEWEFSRHLVEKELQEDDILVVDGTLQTGFPNESKYINQVFTSGEKAGVVITGLSKTCSLFTDSGLALLGAIRQLAKESETNDSTWTYHPVVDIFNPDHRASLYIVKLNAEADRIYRYEIFLDQAKEMSDHEVGEVISKLSENSRDVTLPGYPYGLIVADLNARVRTSELEKYQMMLLSEMSKSGSWEKFRRYIRAGDTHDVLNMLAGG
jgi:hypothetical protein